MLIIYFVKVVVVFISKFIILLFIFSQYILYADTIVGSKHDLSMSNYYGSSVMVGVSTEVCVYCHTPHDSNNEELKGGPIWNRNITDITAFEMYNGAPGTPSNTSRLCLSCHDGVSSQGVASAVNYHDGHELINPPGSGDSILIKQNCKSCHHNVGGDREFPSEAWQIGPILTDDHPVSIDYSNAVAARPTEFKAVPDSDVKLFNGKVECATCHDVHNPEYGLFLRKPNTGSAVCNSCHIK